MSSFIKHNDLLIFGCGAGYYEEYGIAIYQLKDFNLIEIFIT
jgi:hypothetical protein